MFIINYVFKIVYSTSTDVLLHLLMHCIDLGLFRFYFEAKQDVPFFSCCVLKEINIVVHLYLLITRIQSAL